eukprot:3765214-Pleurochrysis_carterae.AAC.1
MSAEAPALSSATLASVACAAASCDQVSQCAPQSLAIRPGMSASGSRICASDVPKREMHAERRDVGLKEARGREEAEGRWWCEAGRAKVAGRCVTASTDQRRHRNERRLGRRVVPAQWSRARAASPCP